MDALRGLADIWGDAGSHFKRVRAEFTLDPSAPSSGVCDGSDGTATNIYSADATVDYTARLFMADGRVCQDLGSATLSVFSQEDGGVRSSGLDMTFGPPPPAGGQVSCSIPTLTLTPSSGLPTTGYTMVTMEGSGYLPNENIKFELCFPTRPGGPGGPYPCGAVTYGQADADGNISAQWFPNGDQCGSYP